MRSLRAVPAALGLALALIPSCGGQDTGLLDLTLNTDPTNPPPQAVAIDLIGSGGIHRSYASKFPPDGATSLRLEYPDLPAGTITFTVQTLDSNGCVIGESPAPFAVAIKAGAKVSAAATVQRSSKPCSDGGGLSPGLDAGVEAGRASEDASLDVTSTPGDSPAGAPVDTAADMAAGIDTGVDARANDAPAIDSPAIDARSVDVPVPEVPSDIPVPSVDSSPPLDAPADSFPPLDTSVTSPDMPTVPVIVSFIASPSTISAGSSTTLTAIFKNATGSSVDHGIGSVTSGNGVGTGPLTTTTTYKLTVTDAAGASASQTVTVTVVPLPSITSFTAQVTTIASGTLTQLTGVFTGGTGSIDNAIGAVTSGAPVPTGVLIAETVFTLKVTNAAGDGVEKQIIVKVSGTVGTGTFAETGTMMLARSSHTATLLPNGKVLIAGGTSARIAELYDPTTATFSATAGLMTAARGSHTATLLGNGKVLIAGGNYGMSADQPSTGELYDPSTETFVSQGSETGFRFDFAAASLPNGAVLLVGASDGPTASTAEVFAPLAGAFTATGNMNASRQNTTATLLPTGQVLVAGGYHVSPGASPYLSTAELYDAKTGVFTVTNGPLIVGRAAQTATLLGYDQYRKVLVVGGVGDVGELTSTELYDPMTGWFQASGPTHDPRYWHAATLLPNGNVLVTGGDTAPTSAELYDAISGGFGAGSTMTVGRAHHTATLLQNGKVLIVGGDTTGTAELYW